jgi:hypothetical protein
MKNTLATTFIQRTSPAPGTKTGGSLATALLLCGLVLVCATARAQSPKLVCNTYTDAWGTPAAVAATTGTVSDALAGYVVAAIADDQGFLEVKAFTNTCKEVGHVHVDNAPVGAPIVAVAAADLDSSQIVTAVVDQNGTLQLRTWAVGGTAGIAALNAGYVSSENTANSVVTASPVLGIAALSPTAVVTTYQDPAGNFILQQWNIPTGGVPAPVGKALNLGGAISVWCAGAGSAANPPAFSQIAIATFDPALSMFITAASDVNENLYVDVWSVGNDGTFGTGGQVCVPKIVNGANPGLAIAGGYGEVYYKSGKYYFPTLQRYAVTPLINHVQNFEVLYWDISSTGAISKTADLVDTYEGTSLPTGTAAAMLPTGVPISAFLQQSLDSFDVNVGWYGYTGESAVSEINAKDGNGAGVYGVSAAQAGATSDPLSFTGTAYFVTGVMTADHELPPAFATGSSSANEGKFQLNIWSYPVVSLR